MLAPGHAGDNCQLQLCPVCGMCLQMLTIGRNVLSDPSKIIQSARFVQEEVRLQHNETVGVATQPHPASCISSTHGIIARPIVEDPKQVGTTVLIRWLVRLRQLAAVSTCMCATRCPMACC
jgi:hypothetical protein